MIHALSGCVVSSEEGMVIIDIGACHLSVSVIPKERFEQGATITLLTYMHWNSETGPALFGFMNDLERHLFTVLISCSGIGPKVALAILTHLTHHELLEAVHTNNVQLMSRVQGIGPKKAAQLILQLKDKINAITQAYPDMLSSSSSAWSTASQTLESLNYSKHEIVRALSHVRSMHVGISTFDAIMRHALSYLAKQS